MSKKILYYVVLPIGGVLFISLIAFASLYKAYTIPTPAMEGSVLVGDCIYCRTSGKTEKGKVTIFVWPGDNKTHYIKRCIGGPGDKILIKEDSVYINNALQASPAEAMFQYSVYTDERWPNRIFAELGIPNFDPYQNNLLPLDSTGKTGYFLYLTKSMKDTILKKYSSRVIRSTPFPLGLQLFPYDRASFEWNSSNYGPIWIPKAGTRIKADSLFLERYLGTIKEQEGHESVENLHGKLMINGKEVTEYTFQKDYYFMMGDSRQNSSDSRFWGFVSSDKIIGTARFIYFSYDKNPDTKHSIRWERIFKAVQ